jgi:hypothetical protein
MRWSGVTAMDVGDLKFWDRRAGRLLIRRSKTDHAGEGHLAYLARDSVRFVKAWLNAAGSRRAGVPAYYWAGHGDLR